MLRSIVRSSLRFPWLVIGVATGLVIIGMIQIGNARKDLLPEFSPTTVEVQTDQHRAIGSPLSVVAQKRAGTAVVKRLDKIRVCFLFEGFQT